jgi:hypothetical protein
MTTMLRLVYIMTGAASPTGNLGMISKPLADNQFLTRGQHKRLGRYGFVKCDYTFMAMQFNN